MSLVYSYDFAGGLTAFNTDWDNSGFYSLNVVPGDGVNIVACNTAGPAQAFSPLFTATGPDFSLRFQLAVKMETGTAWSGDPLTVCAPLFYLLTTGGNAIMPVVRGDGAITFDLSEGLDYIKSAPGVVSVDGSWHGWQMRGHINGPSSVDLIFEIDDVEVWSFTYAPPTLGPFGLTVDKISLVSGDRGLIIAPPDDYWRSRVALTNLEVDSSNASVAWPAPSYVPIQQAPPALTYTDMDVTPGSSVVSITGTGFLPPNRSNIQVYLKNPEGYSWYGFYEVGPPEVYYGVVTAVTDTEIQLTLPSGASAGKWCVSITTSNVCWSL